MPSRRQVECQPSHHLRLRSQRIAEVYILKTNVALHFVKIQMYSVSPIWIDVGHGRYGGQQLFRSGDTAEYERKAIHGAAERFAPTDHGEKDLGVFWIVEFLDILTIKTSPLLNFASL